MAVTARIDELRRKFDENPRRYFAHLANEYRKLGDLESAIAICRRELAQYPEHVSGHIVLGQALYEAGRRGEARGVFEAALRLDPENLIALRHLGDIARAEGDDAGARQWYGRILEADPRNDDVAALLAGVAGERADATRFAPPAPPAAVPPESPALGRDSFADLLGQAERRQEAAAPADEGFVDGWEIPAFEATAPAQPVAAEPTPDTPAPGPRIPVVTGPVANTPATGLPALDPLEAELLGGESRTDAHPAEQAPPAAAADEGFVDELFFDEITPGGQVSPVEEGATAAASGASDDLAVDELSIAPPEPVSAAEPETADWMDAAPALSELGDEPLEPVVGLDVAPATDTAQQQLGAAELSGAELPAAEQWAEELAAAEPQLDQAISGASAVEDREAPAWGEPSELLAEGEPEPSEATGEVTEPVSAPVPEPEAAGAAEGKPLVAEDEPVDVLDLGGVLIEASPPPEPAEAAEARDAGPSAPAVGAHDDAHVDAEELTALTSGAFATETLAELFVQQGHVDQAMAIYERLVAERPDEPALARRLEEVRGMAAGQPSELAAGPEAAPEAPVEAEAEAGQVSAPESEAAPHEDAVVGGPTSEPVEDHAGAPSAQGGPAPAAPRSAPTAGEYFAALAARPIGYAPPPVPPSAPAPAPRAATPVESVPAVQVAAAPVTEGSADVEQREEEESPPAAMADASSETAAPAAQAPEPTQSLTAESPATEPAVTESPAGDEQLLSGVAGEADDRAAHLLARAYTAGEPATGSLVDDLAELPPAEPTPAEPRAAEPAGDDLSFDRFFAGFEDLLSAPAAAHAVEQPTTEPLVAADDVQPVAASGAAGQPAAESPVATEHAQPNESADEDLAQFNAWLKGLGEL